MKLLFALLAVAAVAPAQRIQWTRQFGTNRVEQGNAVGYGEFGVYIAGEAAGPLPGQNSAGGKDAFLSLHDEDGNLKWIRQFGTTGEDAATGVAGDGAGAYVVGYTRSALPGQAQIGSFDSFIRQYDPNGNVTWTRQFGSVTDDYANAVATHTSGVYVVGQIDCCGGSLPGMPATASADAYIRKYSGDGNVLWTRYISTSDAERALGVAVDSTGVYVTGTTNGNLAGPAGQRDGFIRKFAHDGATIWTRQFGARNATTGINSNDDVFAIAVGPGGVYVSGAAAQGAMPGATFAGGLWDAFVVKYDTDGTALWSRQIGTDGDDYAYGLAVGPGYVLVTGGTSSNLVSGAFVGGEDAFLRLYDLDGNVVATRQFGNGLNDTAAGAVAFPGGFFVGGTKNGNSLNLTPLGDDDAFAMKVIPPPFISSGGVLNGASFARGAGVAPGSIAVVFGAYLNDGPQVLSPILGADGKVATSLGGTQITVGGIPAPILYSTQTQVSIQIPYEVTGAATTVSPTVGGQSSEFRFLELASTGPGFFTLNQAGTGEAIALHQDGVTLITAQNPARRGEIVIFYLTGLGALNPALGTGVPAAANTSVAPVTMTFGGVAATPAYAGAAPGFIGLNQINVQIPNNAPLARDVPVAISAGGRSGNPVTIAIGQ